MADTTSLPFNPLRKTLYSMHELFAGFSEGDVESYGRCRDVEILKYFVAKSRHPARHGGASTLEALHDNSISEAVQRLLGEHRRVAAIMGGHAMARGSAAYAEIARVAHGLARAGFLVASGGGPGAMEATHLGAALATRPRSDLDGAIGELRGFPALPESAARLVGTSGRVDRVVAVELHRWLAPAFRLAAAIFAGTTPAPGPSLAVPTWLYGYEPTTPFATHIAKYFQNSVREDGLVTLARNGIVYAEGAAGTVQEIFQDVVQNSMGEFCPMVFLSGPGRRFWSRTLPVEPLVKAILKGRPEYATHVLFTDSGAAAVEFLVELEPHGAAARPSAPRRRGWR
jgi:predicted Rossmann-fold nucleotide-binding protein